MIDVDARGRAAAHELNELAARIASTDESWAEVVSAAGVVPVAAEPAIRRRWTYALAGATAVGGLLVGTVIWGNDGSPRVSVVPGTTAMAPEPTAATTATSSEPATSAPPVEPPPPTSAPPFGVQSADELPALVLADSDAESGYSVSVWPADVSSEWIWPADLALQALDGPVLVDPSGDGPPLRLAASPADEASEIWPGLDMGGPVTLHDVATIGGVPTALVSIPRCDESGCYPELWTLPLDGSSEPRHVIGINTDDMPYAMGRYSLSDSGLIAGSTQFGGRLVVPFLLDSTLLSPTPSEDSPTAMGLELGFNGVPDSDEATMRHAVAVDQSGRAVAWLHTGGLTIVHLQSGERRTISLAERTDSPLPVLDLALTGDGLDSGAVLISAPGQAAYVLDLGDESLTQVADFSGTVTFSAATAS